MRNFGKDLLENKIVEGFSELISTLADLKNEKTHWNFLILIMFLIFKKNKIISGVMIKISLIKKKIQIF